MTLRSKLGSAKHGKVVPGKGRTTAVFLGPKGKQAAEKSAPGESPPERPAA